MQVCGGSEVRVKNVGKLCEDEKGSWRACKLLRRGQDWVWESQRGHSTRVTTRMQELKRIIE